jgi:hypothetical protein
MSWKNVLNGHAVPKLPAPAVPAPWVNGAPFHYVPLSMPLSVSLIPWALFSRFARLKARAWEVAPGEILVALVEHRKCPDASRADELFAVAWYLAPRLAPGVRARIVLGHAYALPEQRAPIVLAEATRDQLEQLFEHFERQMMRVSQFPANHRVRQQIAYYGRWQMRVRRLLGELIA